MSDDEQEQSSHIQQDFAYLESDTTTAIDGPAHQIFVLPSCPETARIQRELQIFTLPHPRTGADALYALSPAPHGQRVLCEVQSHRPPFASFFIDNMIEPDGAIYFLTPIDLTYIALHALLGSEPNINVSVSDIARWYDHGASPVEGFPNFPFKFRCVEDLISCDSRLEKLQTVGLLPALRDALVNVSDVHDISPDDKYFRVSVQKAVEFCAARFETILPSSALRRTVYPPRAAEPTAPAVPTVEKKTARRRSATRSASQHPPEDTPKTPCGPEHSDVPPRVNAQDFETPLSNEKQCETPAPAVPQQGTDDFIRLRALHLVLEYVPRVLHPQIARRCHVEIDTAARATKQARDSTSLLERDYSGRLDDTPEGSSAKKHHSEKSQSVKRIEKQGAPKGTPNIAAMFAKASGSKSGA